MSKRDEFDKEVQNTLHDQTKRILRQESDAKRLEAKLAQERLRADEATKQSDRLRAQLKDSQDNEKKLSDSQYLQAGSDHRKQEGKILGDLGLPGNDITPETFQNAVAMFAEQDRLEQEGKERKQKEKEESDEERAPGMIRDEMDPSSADDLVPYSSDQVGLNDTLAGMLDSQVPSTAGMSHKADVMECKDYVHVAYVLYGGRRYAPIAIKYWEGDSFIELLNDKKDGNPGRKRINRRKEPLDLLLKKAMDFANRKEKMTKGVVDNISLKDVYVVLDHTHLQGICHVLDMGFIDENDDDVVDPDKPVVTKGYMLFIPEYHDTHELKVGWHLRTGNILAGEHVQNIFPEQSWDLKDATLEAIETDNGEDNNRFIRTRRLSRPYKGKKPEDSMASDVLLIDSITDTGDQEVPSEQVDGDAAHAPPDNTPFPPETLTGAEEVPSQQGPDTPLFGLKKDSYSPAPSFMDDQERYLSEEGEELLPVPDDGLGRYGTKEMGDSSQANMAALDPDAIRKKASGRSNPVEEPSRIISVPADESEDILAGQSRDPSGLIGDSVDLSEGSVDVSSPDLGAASADDPYSPMDSSIKAKTPFSEQCTREFPTIAKGSSTNLSVVDSESSVDSEEGHQIHKPEFILRYGPAIDDLAQASSEGDASSGLEYIAGFSKDDLIVRLVEEKDVSMKEAEDYQSKIDALSAENEQYKQELQVAKEEYDGLKTRTDLEAIGLRKSVGVKKDEYDKRLSRAKKKYRDDLKEAKDSYLTEYPERKPVSWLTLGLVWTGVVFGGGLVGASIHKYLTRNQIDPPSVERPVDPEVLYKGK